MKQPKPILHGRDHGRGGADDYDHGIDSSENVGTSHGVHSVESDGAFEAGGQVLQTDAAGGSVWGTIPSGGGSTLDEVVIATGPDAFWKFDETSGTTAFDSSGNGFDLDAGSDAPPTWGQAAGPPGQVVAEFLNTTVTHVYDVKRTSITNYSAGDFTIAGWARYHTIASGAQTGPLSIIGQGPSLGQATQAGWYLGFSARFSGDSRKFEFYVGNSAPSADQVRGDNLLAPDTWYHLLIERVGGVTTMYVDNLVQANTSSHACSTLGSNTLRVGTSDAIPATNHFNGYVSCWGAWARQLTSLEKTRLYEFGLGAGAAPNEYVLTADGTGGTEWDLVRDVNVATDAALTVSKLSGDGAKALGSVAGIPTWLTLAGDVSGALTALAIGTKKVLATMIGSGAATNNKFLRADGSGGASYEQVTDANLSTSDITTNDVTTAKHGFAPKAPNDTAKFLRGDGAWASPGGGGGGTSAVASDVIWDAKGDLAAATGADAAAALTVGANGKVLVAASGQTTGLQWAYPPGYELDYVTRTSNFSVTAASDAAATAVITGNAVSYDGSTRVKIEVWFAAVEITSGQAVVCNVYDGSTDLGRIIAWVSFGGTESGTQKGEVFLTPSNASHTYTIKAWKSGGTATLYASSGGTAAYLPGFMRITTA